MGRCPKPRHGNTRNMRGLTLLNDGQGSEKQKWVKGLSSICERPALGRGEGVTRERWSWPRLPGGVLYPPHAIPPGAYDSPKRCKRHLLQSLVLRQCIIKSCQKERGGGEGSVNPSVPVTCRNRASC